MIALRIINRQRKAQIALCQLEKMATLAWPHCLSHIGGVETTLYSLTAVEITLVSDRTIAALHKRFFHDPSPTDVITFPYGEIIVSAETAAANCQKYGHSPTVETALYIIHGLLHLNGYEDQTPACASEMEKRQTAILEAVCRKI